MTKHSDTFGGALAGTWRQAVGAWATSSGAVECADVQGSTGKYLIDDAIDVGGSDMYAELRIGSTQVNSGSNTGPGIRHRASVVTGYQFAANLNDSHGAWRTSAGAETQIGTFTAAVALNDMLRIEGAGRTLRYKANDLLVALLQDTTITDGQRGAVNGYNNAASGDLIRADDFEEGLLTDDLLAPFVAGWTALVEGVGGTIQPTFTDVQAGDTLLVVAAIRDAAQTVAAPGSQGWSASIQTPSQTGLEGYVFAKRWGLGGQTDSTTPAFTIGSGTAGWVAAGVVIRNPLHATRPWTSATHAILASGSQSNASSTTVTCPSVAYTGDHVTYLTFGGSADDNALGAPNASRALIFGGAAYDSTQGNDEAIAAAVREDVSGSSSTGTATFTEAAVGPDVSFGITLVLAIPSGELGIASETDSPVAVALAHKQTSVGQATTTDSAQATAAGTKATAVGAGAEADSAPARAAATKTTTAALVTGADSAPALAAGVKTAPVGLGSGAESALGLAGQDHGTGVAPGSETATAPPLGASTKTTDVGAAAATESALALAGAVKATDVGAATETGTAPPLVGTIAAATETGTVPALTGAAKAMTVDGAATVEVALALAGSRKETAVGTATETDTARPVTVPLTVIPPSQGTYDAGTGALVYDGTGRRVYDPGRGRRVYDP